MREPQDGHEVVGLTQRVLILASGMLAVALYFTTILVASTVLPVGALATFGLSIALPRDRASGAIHFSWAGFILLSIAIGGLQLMLARGERLDWFESIEIKMLLLMSLIAFYLFLVHSLTTDKPFLDLRLLLNRNYSLGLALVALFGVLNFTPMVGASLFISISVAEVVRSTGMNYARISEIVSPYNRVLALPWATGLWHFESLPELERLSQEISRQAAMIAYINAFGLYTLVSAMAIPLTLLLARARKETV